METVLIVGNWEIFILAWFSYARNFQFKFDVAGRGRDQGARGILYQKRLLVRYQRWLLATVLAVVFSMQCCAQARRLTTCWAALRAARPRIVWPRWNTATTATLLHLLGCRMGRRLTKPVLGTCCDGGGSGLTIRSDFTISTSVSYVSAIIRYTRFSWLL